MLSCKTAFGLVGSGWVKKLGPMYISGSVVTIATEGGCE